MATDRSFVDYVVEQSGLGERIACRKMFGEYGVYVDGRIVAYACDNSLFLKMSDATAALTDPLPRRPPYPEARPHPVADELLDDGDRLREVLLATHAAMPDAKAKKPKAAKKAAPKKSTAKKPGVGKPAAKKTPPSP